MKNKLKEAMKEALKAKDKVRLETIRSLLSEIQYEEMNKSVESLSDDAVLQVMQRELKKRREEYDFAEKGGRADLFDKLKLEIAAIEFFLPKQLSETELEKILTKMKSDTPNINMGAAMKTLKETFAGQYDGKVASDVAKRVLG